MDDKAETPLSRFSRMLAGAWGAYAWIVFAAVLLLAGIPIILARQPAVGRRIAQGAARMLFFLARVPVTAQGMERLPPRSHLLLVNHASFLDAIALTALLPTAPGYTFTTRQQFPAQRLLCPLLKGVGILVLSSGHPKPAGANVGRLAAALRSGENLVVFPEGGFAAAPGLKPFHSGAFVAAANARVPIVVAGLRGTRAALPLGTWWPRRAALTLKIGPVYPPEAYDRAGALALLATARQVMAALAGEEAVNGSQAGPAPIRPP